MLNKYCGRSFETDITNAWKKVLAPEHTLRISEEKAIVDLKNRGQTTARIEGVTSSLQNLSDSVALSIEVCTNLPSEMKLSLSKKGKRI